MPDKRTVARISTTKGKATAAFVLPHFLRHSPSRSLTKQGLSGIALSFVDVYTPHFSKGLGAGKVSVGKPVVTLARQGGLPRPDELSPPRHRPRSETTAF